MEDSLELLRRDFTLLASTNSNLVIEVGKLRDELKELKAEFHTHKALREERDKHIDKRLNAIESIGKWLLVTVLGGFATTIITFIAKGGLSAALN